MKINAIGLLVLFTGNSLFAQSWRIDNDWKFKLGDANLKFEDIYTGNNCKVYQGGALVVIKGNRHEATSTITLNASGNGLVIATAIINTK